MSEHERVPPLGELKATRRDVRDRPARTPEPARDSRSGESGYREYDLLLRESPPRALAIFQQWLAILVRLLGLCFLVVGIGAAVMILREAWTLYQDPVRIERFALAIEHGSNLDKIFALNADETAGSAEIGDQGEAAGDASAQPATSGTEGSATFRPSYFAGWFLVLLLMLVASITAIAAVSAGGRLVLYDTDIRQLSRAVVKEVRRNKGD
ncbi:MAG: hypothetical protein V3V86_10805 [Gammaproteobacteria bacterium]